MRGRAKFVTACAIWPVDRPSSPLSGDELSGGRIVDFDLYHLGNSRLRAMANTVTMAVLTIMNLRRKMIVCRFFRSHCDDVFDIRSNDRVLGGESQSKKGRLISCPDEVGAGDQHS